MDRNSPEYIIYMSVMGIEAEKSYQYYRHKMNHRWIIAEKYRQQLIKEGRLKIPKDALLINTDAIYCCSKCHS